MVDNLMVTCHLSGSVPQGMHILWSLMTCVHPHVWGMLPASDVVYIVMQRAPHNNILATPNYEEWKYYRKMTNFAFSPDNIRKVSARIPT